jgi:antitoxin component YwqK of YwqJK toxin-antitoxin module
VYSNKNYTGLLTEIKPKLEYANKYTGLRSQNGSRKLFFDRWWGSSNGAATKGSYAIIEYRNGKHVNPIIFRFSSNNKVSQKAYFKSIWPFGWSRINDSLSIYYHENGRIKKIYKTKNNKITGVLKEYWDNGQLLKEVNFYNGKMEGCRRQYHPNGECDFYNTWNYKYFKFYSKGEVVKGKKCECQTNINLGAKSTSVSSISFVSSKETKHLGTILLRNNGITVSGAYSLREKTNKRDVYDVKFQINNTSNSQLTYTVDKIKNDDGTYRIGTFGQYYLKLQVKNARGMGKLAMSIRGNKGKENTSNSTHTFTIPADYSYTYNKKVKLIKGEKPKLISWLSKRLKKN